jgi:SAM-dependent methyltransferase
MSVKKWIKIGVRTFLPLSLRKRLAVTINRLESVSIDARYWWTKELLRDFQKDDRQGYHQFLWANHLGYAVTYEIGLRFGPDKVIEARQILFSDLRQQLAGMGLDASRDVGSVLELGSSMGYQLRYFETDLFQAASVLDGIDIDKYAIEEGSAYLKKTGSKVNLICHDLTDLESVVGQKVYDLIIATGVLMYLDADKTETLLKWMAKHCRILFVASGPSNPKIDNGLQDGSIIRESDGSLIHNFDQLFQKAGYKVVARRWEGSREFSGQTLYYVFAESLSR